jgi:ABC-type bacteriocin/lantibiotic exporter with double-glycine peptidase domain
VDIEIEGHKKHNELSRKIALLKLMLRRPRIVIVKDTSWIVGGKDIVELFREEQYFCTVIGIAENPQGALNVQRVILTETGKVLEEGTVQ